ncbi:MAG: EamA family transporter [Gaiellaceae bacterium]
MVPILGGLGAALAWATSTLCASRASREIGAFSLLAWVMGVGMLIVGPAVAVTGIPARMDAAIVGWLVVSGAGNVVGLLLVYKALRIGKVGLVAPITSSEGAVAAVLAVIAGERLAPGVGVTLGIVAVGVVLAATAPSEHELGRRADLRVGVLASLAALSFGFSIYATARVGQEIGIAWAIFPSRALGVLAVSIPLALSSRLRLTRRALPLVIVGGICEVVGFASYTWGARHGLAVSAVLASQFAALTALVGFVLFRERLGRIQLAGVVAIVAGVSVLSALQS